MTKTQREILLRKLISAKAALDRLDEDRRKGNREQVYINRDMETLNYELQCLRSFVEVCAETDYRTMKKKVK